MAEVENKQAESASDQQVVNGANGGKIETAGADGIPKGHAYRLPDAKTLQEAGELKIKDEKGETFAFKSLYEGKPGRQLIIFIRHFYCGNCEGYVRTLSKALPPSVLASSTPPTTLTIVGSGEPHRIEGYRERTMGALGDTPYALYCDPTQMLHKQLGMVRNLKQPESLPEYMDQSMMRSAVVSFKTMLVGGPKAWTGSGPFNQNGGEWLFCDGELQWCKRMQDVGDHAGVDELKTLLGLP